MLNEMANICVFITILVIVGFTMKYCDKKIDCVPINAMVTQCYDTKGERK